MTMAECAWNPAGAAGAGNVGPSVVGDGRGAGGGYLRVERIGESHDSLGWKGPSKII